MNRQLEPKYHGEPEFIKNLKENYSLIDSFEFGKYSIELRRREIPTQLGSESIAIITDVVWIDNRRMYIMRDSFNKTFSDLLKDKQPFDIIGSFQLPNIKEVKQQDLRLTKDLDKYQIGCEFFEEQELKNLQSLINYKFNNI